MIPETVFQAIEVILYVIAVMIFFSFIALCVISSRLYRILNNLREIEKRGRE
jgi:NADH:ubiquinone oxidoreductase subunit 6 (subunit J)